MKIISLTVLLASTLMFSQVGINTETPKATLDVMAAPGDLTKINGFIAPRLKGSELTAKDTNYSIPQTGAIDEHVIVVGSSKNAIESMNAYYKDQLKGKGIENTSIAIYRKSKVLSVQKQVGIR
jgi:hypothetical protein